MSSLRSNLFLVALGLSLLGLVMVYSATYSEVGTDFLFERIGHMVLGVAAFFVASRIRYTSWRKYAPALYLIVLLGLIVVLIPGVGTQINGARRWLDLGPSVVLLAGVAGTLWASELRTRDLVLSGFVGLVAVAGMMVLEPYRRERFLTFLDPWAAADGSGYQVVQSMVAIKAGGFFGSGAGSGGEGPYVPELGTDMIFALIGEELGLIGMVAVIAAFGFIALAGLRIAMNAPSVMARCVAAGLTTVLIAQATFNIGAAMVVLPLAGMTLPFVSYGGSSLLVCFAAVGILYRISEDSERASEIKPRKHAADPDSRRRHGGARYPRAVRGG